MCKQMKEDFKEDFCMEIDMNFIKTEIKNQFVDKMDNMCCSEIS